MIQDLNFRRLRRFKIPKDEEFGFSPLESLIIENADRSFGEIGEALIQRVFRYNKQKNTTTVLLIRRREAPMPRQSIAGRRLVLPLAFKVLAVILWCGTRGSFFPKNLYLIDFRGEECPKLGKLVPVPLGTSFATC